MPSLIGSLFVSLTADFAPFQRNMKSAEGVVATTTAGMRRNVGLTERSVANFHRTASSQIRPYGLIAAARTFDTVQQRANLLRGALFATTAAFGGLGAALTTNVVSRYLDSFTGLENQMRVVSTTSADLAANMSEVQAVAERSRSSLQAVGTLFTRIAKASPEQGVAATLRRVETVNKALQLGGATAQEAASAAIQFSQAIASNRLGGEELRAVLETPLGNELAKAMGVTIGQFRKMGTEGKLTADVLFKALDKMSGAIDQKFVKSVSTIDQALTVADGKITIYAGHLDDAYGITKLMTGAIGSFGNNLETIVPLLAIVGAGLGSIFAGRLIGGSTQRAYNAVAGGIKAVTAARIENMRIEKEAYALAQRTATAARSNVNAAQVNAIGPMPLSAAPKADQKAYLRDAAALTKLESERAAASAAVAAQQAKVSGALRDQRTLTTDLAKANNLANAVRTSRPVRDGDVERLAAAERSVAAAQQAQAAAIRTAQVEQTKLIALKKTEADIATRMTAQRGKVDIAGGTIIAAGAKASATALEETARASAAAEAAILRTRTAMEAATRSAGLMATGLGVLRSGAASLVGFLGGPWGVAFTTAIGLLAYFGSQSRATAEEIARAQEIIDEVTAGPSAGGVVTINERIALSQKKIIAETERLALVTKEAKRQREDYADAAEVASIGLFDDESKRRAAEIIQKFRDGQASIAEFNKELKAVGVDTDAIGQLGLDLIKTENLAELATLAIKRLSASIADMKQQLLGPEFATNIGVEDARFRDENKRQREQYGAGQDAARIAMEEARRGRQLLDAAGDTGDSARNTPAKIAAREQEILEQGIRRTRDAARDLATEELNLAEAQRLANKETKEQTKETEKLADKLRELKETADAAFSSELDRKVADFAKRFEGISAGDIQQARAALLQIGAADTWRQIIQQYGTGAQLAGQFAEKQEELSYLVASGKITAEQAALAWADYLGGFKDFKYIDQTADAFSNFASSAITDFENIGDAFKKLMKDLANIALQALVLDPFKDWIKQALGSMVNGGATAAPAAGAGLANVATNAVGRFLGGAGSSPSNFAPSSGVYGSDLAENFKVLGAKLGVSARDLAAASHYESGFRPNVIGGAGRRYQGLIQAGPSERAQYGIHPEQGLASQFQGIENFFKGRGLKPGMGIKDIYSTINAGSPGRYNASDAANGGLPGTVADKVKTFGPNYAAADKLLGGSATSASAALEKLATGATSAKDGIGTLARSLVGGNDNALGGLFNLGLSNTGSGFMDGRGGGLLGMLGTSKAGVLGGAGVPQGGGGLGIFGSLLSFLPKLFGFADGGRVRGSGGPRSDKVPILASPGEFIVQAAAAGRNRELLEAINNGSLAKFASGGRVSIPGRSNMSSLSRLAMNSNAPVPININVDGANGDEHVRMLVEQGIQMGLQKHNVDQSRGGFGEIQRRYTMQKG